MPALTATPNPAAPSSVVSVTGVGFPNARTRLLLDGVGATTNIFRPRKDGTFTVGITVSATPKTQTLVAQQLQSVWTEVARTSVVVQAVAPPPPTSTYPPDTTLAVGTENADPRPAYLTEITDATWGTKVRRISDVHLRRNVYAKQGPWNKDGTRIAFGYDGQWRILDGSTYAVLGTLNYGVDYFQWSNVTAAKMYGAQWDIGVRTNTGVPGVAWTTLRTFPGYGYVSFGGNEGNLSDTDNLMGLVMYTGVTEKSGNCRIVAYDPVADVVRGIIDSGTSYADSVGVSASGTYLNVNWDVAGTGDYNGSRLYTMPAVAGDPLVKATGASYTTAGLLRSNISHAVMGKNAGGADVFITLADGGNVHLASTNAVTGLFNGQSTNFNFGAGGHVSASNLDRPGWAYLSSGVRQTGKVGNEQIVAIKLDGTATVEVFAFAHAANVVAVAGYDATPFAAPNRAGTKVIWGSAWDGHEATEVYAFVAGMTT